MASRPACAKCRRTNPGPLSPGGFCPDCDLLVEDADGDDGLGFVIGYRLTLPCPGGAVTTATRMDRHDRLFDRFEDEVDDLFAAGHSLVTVEWDTIHGTTEYSHFLLALRGGASHGARVFKLSPD